MFWGLLKLMWYMLSIPLKLTKTLLKFMAVIMLPMIIMKAVRWMVRNR
jgi:hypothetical protein